jgi:[pyruvate, water dikinase]-phosphate phosphotransferase / [pyruvate, water dikinase] kinase
MLTVLLVSGSTGKTAERVVRAALAQFGNAPVKLVRRGHVRTSDQVSAVVRQAADTDSIIVHTLVSHELRRQIVAESRLQGVDAWDAIGPILDRIATHLKTNPQEKPGLFEQLNESRSREIEAVSFAFHHDDGQKVEDLDRAEVVIVGASRTMKTPTMLYMAYRGWFAANVPIILEVDLPPTILSLPPERVFCLLNNPTQLKTLRHTRAAGEAIPLEPYTSLDYIKRELAYSRQLCQKHGWRIIGVSGKSVEEVCREIITLLPNQE